MRIGVVTFHPEKKYVGGGQIPSFAFMKWVATLGLTPVDVHHEDYNAMNSCDWIFFGTAGRMNTADGKFEFDFSKLNVPYVVMVHAEFDKDIYPQFNEFISDGLCKLIVVIGHGYWNFDRQVRYWHPCTMPEYLLREGDKFDNSNRYGLLYAARVSRWKGINKLAVLSNFKNFMDEVDWRIDVYGEQTSEFEIENGNFNWKRGEFSIFDFHETKERNSQYKYFWDVCGTPSYSMPIKRLNLAAVEAMKFGCIPIADPSTAYPFSRKFIVDLNRGFPKSFKSAQDHMLECALQSPLSYDSVKKQVLSIIDFMGEEV